MKKKIIILILAFVLVIPKTNAAKSYSVTRDTYGIENSDYCNFPVIEDVENCVSKNYKGYHVGNGETFKISYNGETLNGYCIDPGVDSPQNVAEQPTSEISKYIEGFKYICEQTEGNEVLRGVLLKAYSIDPDDSEVSLANIVGKDPSGTKTAYLKLLDGETVINKKYDPQNKGLDILKTARNKTNTKASTAVDPSFKKENGQLKLNATVPGTIKIANAEKYEITIYGAEKKDTGVYAVSAKGDYTISITYKNCTENITENVSVSFEYEKNDLGLSSSNYNVRYFASEANKLQRLITCEKLEEGENPNCVGNDCKINDSVEITCEGEKCEEPVVEQGSELCGDNGDTIITVTETPNKLDYIGNNCFGNLPEATETILGHSNNGYCEIRCSENYKLELPGPDATKGDTEVKINAGSYFTIATEDENGNSLMYDETTYTCYGKMNFSKYQNDLYTIKNNVVKYYNDMAEVVGRIALLTTLEPDADGYCPATEKYYDTLEVDSAGKFSYKTNGGSVAMTRVACTESDIEAEKKSHEATLKEKKEALEKYIVTANAQIETANAQWNECTGWSIEKLNDLYKDPEEQCSAQIDFDYASENICGIEIEVDEIDYIEEDKGDIQKYTSTATSEKVYNGTMDVTKDLSAWNTAGTTEAYSYINQQATITTKYKFNNDFTVEYATGKISCEAKTGDGYSDIIHGFPVSRESQQGIHEYEYTYSNIGHNFDAGTECSGRFDEDIKSKDSHKCNYNVNNCDDCEVYCGPKGNCDSDNCDGKCQVACVGKGCILDVNAGFLATYRTVSLNETFTVATLLSAEPAKMLAMVTEEKTNYSSNTDFAGSNWTNEKGNATSTKIAALGESIYDEEPEYSITLTPAVISEIKKYNAEQEDFDESDAKGYLNNTLKCTNVNGTNYGQCISNFVHDDKWDFQILDEATSADQVVVEIDGDKAVFESYKGATKAFAGPAWK